jgi:hypothetical protein
VKYQQPIFKQIELDDFHIEDEETRQAREDAEERRIAEQNSHYPKSVYYIFVNEICERYLRYLTQLTHQDSHFTVSEPFFFCI